MKADLFMYCIPLSFFFFLSSHNPSMKLNKANLPTGKKQNQPNCTIILLGLAFTILPLLLIIKFSPLPFTLFFSWSSSPSSFFPSSDDDGSVVGDVARDGVNENCDLFTGEWVPNPSAPYYTNETCSAIYDHQNCMRYGRPDLEFLKWRWKPDDCELPIFDPYKFLEMLQEKSLAFVGDSVGRNQMQSLMCLLSGVESPVDITNSTNPQSKRWKYTNHNFTVENFWSPYLVKTSEPDPTHTKPLDLYLDEFDKEWTTRIDEFDYVIISGGHWFFHPYMLFENNTLTGCHYCPPEKNATNFDTHYAYRKAFHTAFRAINSLNNFKGITFLRTFAPSHFENGSWNEGGDCVRRRPFMRNETRLENNDLELYMAQIEEFRVAEIEGLKKRLKFRLLDTTQVMLMRPDGHPSKYGHWRNVKWPNDCLHWCLPGPIDTWNDFLLEMLRLEETDHLKD